MHQLHELVFNLGGGDVDIRHGRQWTPVAPAALLLHIAHHTDDLALVAAAQIQVAAERIVVAQVHVDERLADHHHPRCAAVIGGGKYAPAQQRNAQHAEVLGSDVEQIGDLSFGIHVPAVQAFESRHSARARKAG
jgi:hypothetical protein